MEAHQATTDESEYECKHCGETTDELVAEECEESSMGFHAWNHTNPEDTSGTDATVVNNLEDRSTNGKTCPNCGASENKQVLMCRPAQNTDVEMSLPDRVYQCDECRKEWEQ